MTILQNTRFRIAVGIAAVVLAAAAIGAGTYAAFSDTEDGPNGSMSQFLTSGLPLPGTLGANATTTYTLRFALPDLSGTTNNKVQGDSINLTSTFDLVQA
jgi:predicted ribosomally synthesized peptide with SipW-like signal peptide